MFKRVILCSTLLSHLVSLFSFFKVINITTWDDGKKFEVQLIEVKPCNQSQGKLLDTSSCQNFIYDI